ncbi:MAG: hypothetical protein U0324_29030 [Polyangiales bacterium]
MNLRTPRPAPLAAALALVAAAPLAAAQSGDPALAATRRDLIEQARAARTANDHPRALDLAARAGQIEMSPSLRRFIAEEQEAAGRVAEALNSAELCVREAGAARDGAAHVEACRAVAGRVQPRVGRVTVTPPSPPPPGLRVRVAGNEVPAAVWGVPVIVTPGAVVVEAEAPSFRAFRREVTVAVAGSQTVAVALEAAPVEPAPAPTAPVPAPAVTPPVVAPPPVEHPPPPVQPAGGTSVGPFVLMGVGALALGGAAAFLALSYTDAGEPCADNPAELCTTAAADTYNTLGWVSLGVGVSAVVGGVVWFVLDRRAPSTSAPRATLTGAPLPGGGTLGLRLTF